jgi:hypothetical protein
MVQTGDACVHAVTAFVLESTQRTSRLTPEIFQDSDTLTLQGGTVKDENGRLLNGEHKEKPQVFKLFRNSKNECEIKHENTARMSLLPTCNCEVIPPAPPSSTPSTPTTWMRENY